MSEEMPMTVAQYQAEAARTLISDSDAQGYSGHELRLVWNALGLAGEAGEVADVIKKAVFHDHGLNLHELEKELGDVCWYLAALCTVAGLPLERVMAANIAKLKTRYPAGWSTADSQARRDVPVVLVDTGAI